MTGDHIRQRLAERLRRSHGRLRTADEIAAALEQTVRDLIADELDAAADDLEDDDWQAQQYGNHPATLLRDRAAAVRARTEETT